MRKLITGTSIVLLSSILVNAGNYGLTIFLARFLGPAAFSEAIVLSTLVLGLSFFGLGIQLTGAKYLSECETIDQRKKLVKMLKTLSIQISLGLVVVMALLSSWIISFLNFTETIPVFILILCIPFYFLLSTDRAYYQANQTFSKLAWSYMLEMIIRSGITILLILGSDIGFATAIAVGYLCSFLIPIHKLNEGLSPTSQTRLPEGYYGFFASIMVYELAQLIINYSDLMLVRHFFNSVESGLYGSISTIGKIVYFASWSLVLVLVPKVVELKRKGQSTNGLFVGVLSIVSIVSAGIILSCFFFGQEIIVLIMGNEYAHAGPLLWKYALSTSLFSVANMMCYYNLSLERCWPVSIVLLFGVLQAVLISLFHNSIEVVIMIQISLMSILVALMLVAEVLTATGSEKLSFLTKKGCFLTTYRKRAQ